MVRKIVNYNLNKFFQYFSSRGFDLLVLRGYEGLPENYGGDLDLEIPRCQYESFVNELLGFCSLEGLHLFRYVYRPHVSSFKFYRVRNDVLEKFIIDVTYRGGTWFGFSYLSNEELFAKSHRVGLWRVPSTLHELALKAFTNMLIGSNVPEKYFSEFGMRLPDIREEFIEFVRGRFPGTEAVSLYEALVTGNKGKLSMLIPQLKRSLIKAHFQRSPMGFLKALKTAIHTIVTELYYYSQRNGLKVYLLCNCDAGQAWIESFKRHCGHIFKRVVWFEAPKGRTRSVLQRLRQEVELFRDRLVFICTDRVCDGAIIWRICSHCCQTEGWQEMTVKEVVSPPEGVLRLYELLEKRNRRRERSWLYRELLWRLFGYKKIWL